jgi:hypothetical protein
MDFLVFQKIKINTKIIKIIKKYHKNNFFNKIRNLKQNKPIF